MDTRLPIWTDGSYRPLPESGAGGWAWVTKMNGAEQHRFGSGGFANGRTSMRMELQAMLAAITSHPDEDLMIWTDHQGFAEKFNQPAQAIRLWLNRFGHRGRDHCDLLHLLAGHVIEREVGFGYVKGHAGQPENCEAHRLANKARKAIEAQMVSGVIDAVVVPAWMQ